jgi:predicted nucleic acid-binding Zn ribbon protein
MPLYSFTHPETGEIKDIFFHMDEEPKEFTDKEGTPWNREWSSPQLNTQGSVDPWSNADFVNKTAGKGTMGDLLDRSKELSDQRAQEAGGKDPIKEKYYKKYAKDRGGAPHPDKMKKTFENKNIKIELD